MDKVEQLTEYIKSSVENKMADVVNKKLSVEDFIILYNASKDQVQKIKDKAETDDTVRLLINMSFDLLTEINSLKESKKDGDALIKRLSSEIEQLKSEIAILKQKDTSDDFYRWKKEFDKWKDSPYYQAPNDWPPLFNFDSLFESLNKPHYWQSNKAK